MEINSTQVFIKVVIKDLKNLDICSEAYNTKTVSNI